MNQTAELASTAVNINIENMVIGVVFILIAGILSVIYGLRLEKDLAIGTLRSIVQLAAMGYLLKIIFGLNSIVFVMIIFIAMTFFAAEIIKGRVKKQKVSYFLPTLLSVQITFFLVTFIVTAFIVQVKPWWSPQYFITMGGMIAGNSMSALAISLDRFFSDLKSGRQEVEMQLCLGASSTEASKNIFRNALRAGMIPSINNMMGAGLVTIPGMMTGQILAGSDPTEAFKYQIVVMLMLVASTAIASLIVLKLIHKKCFGEGENLLI